jgi:hypothetical protein
VILLALLLSLRTYSQEDKVLIIHIDQTRYCLTEKQALLTVELDRENEIHKGKVIYLKGANEALISKVNELELKISDKDTIQSASNELLDIEAERLKMTKKELRQAKRKAITQWFKDNYEKFLIGVGAFGAGAGVGFGLSTR